MRLHTSLVLFALATTLGCALPLGAQRTSPTAAPGFGNMVAINPLGIPFAIASLEYAADIGGGAALGINASYVGPSGTDDRFTTVEAQGRYYPNERVFDGFSVGLTAGITNYSASVTEVASCAPPSPACAPSSSRESVSLPGVGVVLDYDWILGTRQRFLVGAGIGAKRLFGNTGRLKDLGGNVAYPTGRIVIGLLF